MPSSDVLQHLVWQLSVRLKQSSSGNYFITGDSLDGVLTSQTITKTIFELKSLPEDHINLAHGIQHELLVTFAILIWIHLPAAIIKFRRSGHDDGKLPLSEAGADLLAPECANIFHQEQYQFLPHVFRLGDDRKIEQSVILPFVRQIGTIDTGGFGAIDKVEIHPSLQNFELRSVGFHPPEDHSGLARVCL